MIYLAAALLGGIVGLDGTAFPQAMISRPIVAGAIAGWIVGQPLEGAMMGAMLETFHLAILPIGAARYPESGTAAAAAACAFAWANASNTAVSLLLALAFSLVWERLTGGSVNVQRRVNEYVVALWGGPHTTGAVERRHLLAMLLDFMRGATVTMAGAGAGVLWLRVMDPIWNLGPGFAGGVIVAAAAGTAAAAIRVFGGWTARWKVFVAGLCTGLLFLLVR
jgi:mannose/fructose/N-acetylgalactosamine-specific phosphotransferase system component IIC